MASQITRMSIIYCTIISESFVPRALVLRDSIINHSPEARFGFYCVDNDAADLLDYYVGPTDIVVRAGNYESDELKALKGIRKLNEYCWTCKPAALIHASKLEPRPQWVVWLDSDMMAFGDIGSVFERHANASAVLTPHRFSLQKFAEYEPFVGHFNAGFVAFQTSPEGLAALDWWMGQCLRGCPAQPEAGRYADQKYLDAMPDLFPRVAASLSPGLNCAPWNVFGRKIGVCPNGVTLDDEPLLLYHFQGLKIIRSWAYDLYGSTPSLPKAVRKAIYKPYLIALTGKIRDCAGQLKQPLFGVDQGFAGLAGFVAAARRMRVSPNLVFKI